MPRILPKRLAAAAVLLLTALAPPAPTAAEPRRPEILVRLAPDGQRALHRDGAQRTVPRFLETYGIKKIRPLSRFWPGTPPPLLSQFKLDNLYAMEVAPTKDLRNLCSRLTNDPRVEFAEPASEGEGGAEQALPLDSYFFDSWRLRNTGQLGGFDDADLDVVEAWTTTIGHPDTLIAVLDSGIDGDHREFRGRIVPGGYDSWNDDPDPEDDHSHGTRVSGLIAANANNRFGVTGLNWRAGVLPIKVLDDRNRGNNIVLIEGLLHAAAVGADIANLSLIHYADSPSLQNSIAFAHAAGVILIGCHGNDGTDFVSYPAAYTEVFSSGWSNDRDLRDPSSNHTPTLDAIAPGRSVRTATWNSSSDTRSFFSGCSAATPSVTGTASLLLALDPTLRFEQVRDILRATAEDEIGNLAEDLPGRDDYYGWGRVNTDDAARSLGLASDGRMHVDRIDLRRVNTTQLEVAVAIVDEWAGVEAGALVNGILDTPTASGIPLVGTTGSNGIVLLLHDNGATLPAGPYRFEVTDVSLEGWVYAPPANRLTERTQRPDFDGIHIRSVEFARSPAGLVVRVQVVDDDEIHEGGVTVDGTLTPPTGPAVQLQATTKWAAGGTATFGVDSPDPLEPGSYAFTVTQISKSGFEHEDGLDAAIEATLTVISPEADPDGDGIPHDSDNCPAIANPGQVDADLDGFGDACDVCPTLVDFAQRDTDGDGTGNRCDCARYDPARVGLSDVTGFILDADRRTLRWSGVSGADRYDVTRGSIAALDGSDFGACIEDDRTSREFEDDSLPAPGEGFFYLIRADDAICGAGPAGFGMPSIMRINTNPAGCS